MVGLVIISHSPGVASGCREMALQMTGGDAPIVACGGNRSGGLGTDPDAILAAVKSLWTPDGIVVLADLGSAVMSAEMVLDMLPGEQRERVVIADAPVVEGAILAAVEASLGKDLNEVRAAAEGAAHMHKTGREG